MRFYKSILFFLFVALQVNSVAQTFPVSANLQLVPPYSVYLSDYTLGGNEQMKLNLFLRDLNEPSYAVKLFFVLEGAGIRIETNPNFAPPPIVLEGGVPQVLGADELGTYLDPRNLLFNGITRQQYEQRAALPEGFYKFSFRVLDYRRKDVQLSREATANAWFVLNDPPRLNTPVCGTTLPLRDPQNIFFQWLPMGAASPNSALTTEYEFTLVEIRPPGRNPNDAINVGLPLFQFTTLQTSLVYGILEPALIPGQEYAFRVRAKDTNGKDLFKNQGYSEVCTFKFGEVQAVPPPEGLNIYPESERRAKVTWYQMLEADRYRVEYRKKLTTPEEANRAWFTKETLEDNTVLNDLEAETEYELRVANVVKNINSRYTETKTFRTLPVRVFACGQQVDNITPANQKPLISPFIGQLWKIGQFEMEVMQVRGSNGTYSGLGAVIVPYLGFRVYGTFTDIKVNENREVIVGTVVGLSEGVEAFKKRFEKEVPQVQIGDPTATAGTNQPVLFDGVDEKTDKDLDSVYVDSKGTIVVVDSEGGQEEIKPTKGKGTRITDKNGDQWIVDKDGKVSKVPSTAISNAPPTTTLTSASQASYTIEFLANNSQRNGFDQKEDAYSLADYETIKIKGKDYIMAWKSVESGQQDWVNAKATGQASFPKAVGFKTSAGEATSQAANDAGQKQVTVMGRDDGQEEELTAYVKIKEPNKDKQVLELGKLSIKSYSKVRKKVIVVPVNDADVPDGLALAAELNRIYKQAVAEWDVTVAEPFTIDVKSIQGLDDGQSGIFSSFPPKMRDFKNAFKDARNVDGKAYYVFLVKGSGAQRAGFMPFKREFGFVFTDRAANQFTTIAHELGHGVFRLRHTFSSDAFKASERTTTNLMDYNGGTTLKKYQWDFVHDPESMSGWLQDDEESAMTTSAIVIQLQNGGISITYKNIRDALKSFRFTVSKSEVLFTITNAEANPVDLGQTKIKDELDALFQRAGKYLIQQAGKREFSKTTLEQWVWSKQDEIKKYIEGLISEVQHTGLEDLAGLSDAESNVLKSSIKKFKDQQGIDPTVTVVDETLFNLLKSKYQSGERKPSKDVHLVVDRTGKNYAFFYKDGFFTIPTQKIVDGQSVQLSGTQAELFDIRDKVIATAISNDEIEGIGKINEPTLNIFEKGMWVVKVTKETLAEVKVPEPMWDKQKKTEASYPFALQATVAGVGDGLIDEVKSIPDLLVMALSLFNKEDRDNLKKAVTNINIETIKKMFVEKADKYKNGGDVAFHEAGVDGVAIASIVLGGLLKEAKDAASNNVDEVGDAIKKLPDEPVLDRVNKINVADRDKFEILKERAAGAIDDTDFDKMEILAEGSSKKLSWPELKELWRKAKEYEANVTDYYKKTGQYDVYTQVYLKSPDGTVSVIDNLLRDKKTGQILLSETKFGKGNKLTTNQKKIHDLITSTKGEVELEIRSGKESSVFQDFPTGFKIKVDKIERVNSLDGSTIKPYTEWSR